MATFLWQKKYEIGHRFIDLEHKVLFEIGNELADNDFTDVHQFKKIYLDLIEYSNLHFKNEETVMKNIGYVSLDIHHNVHQEILNEMKDLVKNTGSLKLVHRNLVSLVTKWIVNHIIQEDMQYKTVYQEWKKRRV